MGDLILMIDDLKNDLNHSEIRSICSELAKDLELPTELDKELVLLSLAGVETNFARNNKSRNETHYGPGGRYFTGQQKDLYLKYGALASCSYGPWQIMAIKAFELGYRDHPLKLWDGKFSGPFVVKNLNRIVAIGAKTMEDVLDGYNTGSFRVGEQPKEYINKFWAFYERLIEEKQKQKEEGI